eukprot:TRINITY_DN3192_c0_g1_i1.p1 TRINITY_DN3192_c0_g1~~TRINITY_DN3192_c0_g1_i1.p1  ORF type:complete len:637 (+),score=182.12 TRINITY_DN3192_c0_g1_i1:129-2039(+)
MVATTVDQSLPVPPPDLRSIVDKTAEFVARLGEEFATRIYNTEITQRNNPKFSFLKAEDVFHPYFKQKILELKITPSEAPVVEMTPAGETTTTVVEQKQKRTLDYYVKKAQRVEAKEPPRPSFILDLPPIPALDLDIMKLTAQFITRNGKAFHAGLITREAKNPQFDFLHPHSPLNGFFNLLVEAYTKCMLPQKGIIENLEADQDRDKIMQRIYSYTEWERIELRNKKSHEELLAEEKSRALIDWHDFVVVETIDFETEEAPVAMEPVKEEAMETDVEMEVEEEIAPEPTEIKVRKTYTRAYDAINSKAVKFQVCPICKEEIPVNEMAEHMRIELLDPKYQAEKKAMMEKIGSSSLAGGDEITRHLNKFAARRTDIFGKEEVEIGRALVEDETPQKSDKTIWDGHTASIARTSGAAAGMSIEEQIAAIHQKVAKPAEEKGPVVGPTFPSTLPIATPAAPAAAIPKLPTPPVPPMPQMAGMRPPLFPTPPLNPALIPGAPRIPLVAPGIPIPPVGIHPHPTPEEEPQTKKQKLEGELIPEQQFLAENPGPINVKIQLPVVEKGNWNLNGQTLEFTLNPGDTVARLKELVKEKLQMPQNKQNLKVPGQQFMKDANTLAFYNLRNDTLINLTVKERGGR